MLRSITVSRSFFSGFAVATHVKISVGCRNLRVGTLLSTYLLTKSFNGRYAVFQPKFFKFSTLPTTRIVVADLDEFEAIINQDENPTSRRCAEPFQASHNYID